MPQNCTDVKRHNSTSSPSSCCPNLRNDATESREFKCMVRGCCKSPCGNMRSIIFITNLLSKVNTLALTLPHVPLITLLCFVLLRFYSRRDNTWSIIHYKQALFFLSPCPQPPTHCLSQRIWFQSQPVTTIYLQKNDWSGILVFILAVE